MDTAAICMRVRPLLGVGVVLSLFRYGVVLKELRSEEEAKEMFLCSLSLTPLLWSSWQELAKLCKDREMVYTPPSLPPSPL